MKKLLLSLLTAFTLMNPVSADITISPAAAELLTRHVLTGAEITQVKSILANEDAPVLVDKLLRDRANLEFLYYDLGKLHPGETNELRARLDALGAALERSQVAGATDAEVVANHQGILSHSEAAWIEAKGVFERHQALSESRFRRLVTQASDSQDDVKFQKVYGRARLYFHRLNGSLVQIMEL